MGGFIIFYILFLFFFFFFYFPVGFSCFSPIKVATFSPGIYRAHPNAIRVADEIAAVAKDQNVFNVVISSTRRQRVSKNRPEHLFHLKVLGWKLSPVAFYR